MIYRLNLFRGEEVTHQQDSISEDYLYGYAEGYLNFCDSDSNINSIIVCSHIS